MSRLRSRDRLLAAGVGMVVAAVTWVALDQRATTGPAERAAAGWGAGASAPHTALAGPRPLTHEGRLVPTALEIPAIGVRSALAPLQLRADGVLQPPTDYREAGWFADGPAPGEQGPAVVAGHVDSRVGPGVFAALGRLRPGDVVLVERSDGTSVRFHVRSTLRFPKDTFPTQSVYGPTPLPTLRLVTCGGTYDHARQRYPDDVVVFAEEA